MTLPARPAVRSLHLDVRERPFLVIWEVTRACALACRHCRAESVPDRDPRELDAAAGRRFLDDLAAYGPPRPIVVLTGGDPFERPDLAELVAHGHSLGLTMALSPSVTPRLTREVLVELRAAGASAVSISLDGATADVHDGFRGVPGVFDRTLDAMRWVREAGLRLQVNTTVTRGNVDDLPGVLGHVAAAGAGLWSVFFLVPTGRGGGLEPLDAPEVEQVLHWLHENRERVAIKTTEAPHFRRVTVQRSGRPSEPALGPLHASLRASTLALLGDDPAVEHAHRPRPPLDVNAGRGFAFVSHVGDVYPSGFLPLRVGSVHEQPFSTIYRDAPLLRALRQPEAFHGRCGICELRDVCGGSRSHAFAVSGDPLGEDPTCVHTPTPVP